MKAVIPVAGYATRLYPLTKDTPKALLKVGDKRMIEHILAKIEEVPEIDEVHLVTNEKFYKAFLDWKVTHKGKVKVNVYNDGTKSNEDRLGAVGDMYWGIDKGKVDDDIIVIAGDNLFEFSLNSMVEMFRENGRSVVAGRDLKDKSLLANKFGVIESDKDGVITSFEEKPDEPKSSVCATFIYLINRAGVSELKRLVKAGKKPDNGGDFIRHLSESEKVYCYEFDDRWTDIGDIKALKAADEYMKGK